MHDDDFVLFLCGCPSDPQGPLISLAVGVEELHVSVA